MELKIDTKSQEVVYLSLESEGQVIASFEQKNKFGSQILLPALIGLFKKTNLGFFDIKDIEVQTGPGSYTGLRVGVAIANALAFCLRVKVNNKNFEGDLVYT